MNHNSETMTSEQALCELRQRLTGDPCACVPSDGMELTIKTNERSFTFQNVHVDSVSTKGEWLIWEETGPEMKLYSFPLANVLYYYTK